MSRAASSAGSSRRASGSRMAELLHSQASEGCMAYLWLKAFHIIGVVAWFAGLFYLVRLFVYHVEAAERPEPERAVLQPQFALMERRLYRIITRPAMVLTLATAAGMLAL